MIARRDQDILFRAMVQYFFLFVSVAFTSRFLHEFMRFADTINQSPS